MFVFSLDSKVITAPAMSFPSCIWHADCAKGEFCGVTCWTGGCYVAKPGSQGRKIKFCQPCTRCEKDTDSVTRSCDICKKTTSMTTGMRIVLVWFSTVRQFDFNVVVVLLVLPDIKGDAFPKSLYRACSWHSHCEHNQFCGTKCWTGGCIPGKGKKKFCQSCEKCIPSNI